MSRNRSARRRRKDGAPPPPSSHAPSSNPGADDEGWLENRFVRLPVLAIALTLLILVTAIVATTPIRDAVTRQPTPDAQLRLSIGYLLLAPVSSLLDTLTLLAVPQHIAIGAWTLGLYGWLRVRARRRTGASPAVREVLGAAKVLLGLVIVYGAVAYLPRPMARLEVTRDDVYAVDFHAHTNHSHDGRTWHWNAARLREWERGAGFDAAYISDHATFDGARDGMQANPPVAGKGTVLLQAIEAYYNGEHVNVLSAGNRFKNLTTADLRDVDPQSLTLMSMLGNVEPVLIETVPGNFAKMVPAKGPRTAGVRAIELIDGSPRGLTQTRHDHARILKLSDSLDLAVVAGSDNHGYGRAAAGWTLLRAENWKSLSPDSLSKVIELALRVAGHGATKVVERRVAGGGNLVTAALTPVLVPWRMCTTLSLEERVSWLVWIWALAFARYAWRSRPGAAGS